MIDVDLLKKLRWDLGSFCVSDDFGKLNRESQDLLLLSLDDMRNQIEQLSGEEQKRIIPIMRDGVWRNY